MALSKNFFVVSLLAIVVNAIWVGVDIEMSGEAESPWPSWFPFATESFFCVIFTAELAVRLAAKHQGPSYFLVRTKSVFGSQISFRTLR